MFNLTRVSAIADMAAECHTFETGWSRDPRPAGQRPFGCLVNVQSLNKIGPAVLDLWPWMSLHYKDAH